MPQAPRPLAPYIGGKRALARHIVPRIDAGAHDLYAEPFVGLGGIFLRRTKPARVEAINDRSADVVTLFRIARHHPQALLEDLRWQLVSRADFQRLMALDPGTLTDVQRAARFVALQRMCYGGKVLSRVFPARTKPARSFTASDLDEAITALHQRLARVAIEWLDFEEFIGRYDRPDALFYLDPPYYGVEYYYGRELFVRDDYSRLCTVLSRLKGQFIMSINDHPDVRAIFGQYRIEEIQGLYYLAQPRPVTELLISGPS